MILNLNHVDYDSVLSHLRLLPSFETIKEFQGLGNLCVATMNCRPTALPQDCLIVYNGNQMWVNVA